MPFLSPGADMARPSRTGGKTSEARARNASAAKGRKITKVKRRIAPAATRAKRRSVSSPSEGLKEAREQQAATAEILKAIASSPDDVQPVFDAIATSSKRLIGGFSTAVFRFLDGIVHLAAYTPISPAADAVLKASFPRQVAELPYFDLAKDGQVFQEADTETNLDRRLKDLARARGFRSTLLAPLMSKETQIGLIVVTRKEPGPFAAHHVELLQTFADQAVIAIENARLFDAVQAKTSELTEALTYQTGSSNILKVIASSPTDVQPVLTAIVESACELCEAYDALVRLRDGDRLEFSAHHGPIPVAAGSLPISRNWTGGLAAIERKPVHIHDLLSSEGDPFPEAQKRAREYGHRSILTVPMLREGESVGVIIIRRNEVHPFTDKQIALLQTFADQAVIAIGNVRLFQEVQARTRDLTESLQHQTATSDVLQAIGSSMADAQPAFDRILDGTMKLFNCRGAAIFLAPPDGMLHLAGSRGFGSGAVDRLYPRPIVETTAAAIINERRQRYIPNALNDVDGSESLRRTAEAIGNFSVVMTPMLWEGRGVGMISVTREPNERFNDKELNLLKTFADQAVIAIENARLFDEVQAKTRDLSESLQQQTATADVLKVISRSTFDLEAVLDALLASACRLCEADIGTIRYRDGSDYRLATTFGCKPEWIAHFSKYSRTPDRSSVFGRTILEGHTVHIPDVLGDPDFKRPEAQKLMGFRAALGVPLVREGQTFGVISLFRSEVGSFTEKQIELVSTFADQAVIAIENVRLFEQVQARTDELAASLDDLRTAQNRLVQTEKLASLGQLTAGIAHEIKNPLNFVNNFSAVSAELTDELNDVLKPVVMDGKVRGEVDELTDLLKTNLEKVVQHGKRADSIVKNMLLHSREGSGQHRLADINSLIDESLNLAYHGARAEKGEFNIRLQREFDASAGTIEIFPQEITRALLNLISNGVYAATKRKTETKEPGFEPILRATTKNLGSAVEIRIRDNGTGIPAEVQEKIFNPFFTTKPAGEGTGLGLSMTHDIIVKQHGGRIDVATELGQFTEFTIVLPRKSRVLSADRGET